MVLLGITPAEILEIKFARKQTKNNEDDKNTLNESNEPIAMLKQHVMKSCINISLLLCY